MMIEDNGDDVQCCNSADMWMCESEIADSYRYSVINTEKECSIPFLYVALRVFRKSTSSGSEFF